MGYDQDRVVGHVVAGMICSVCRDVFQDPKELQCGHQFCMVCLQMLQKKDGTFECPLDRKNFPTFDEPSQFFKQMYFDLKVKCQWQRFGCTEELVIGSEHTHELQKCTHSGLIERPCARSCGFSGPQVDAAGTEHDCVLFLKDQIVQQRLDYKQLICRLELRLQSCVEDLKMKDDAIKYLEGAHLRVLNQLYPLTPDMRGSGDA